MEYEIDGRNKKWIMKMYYKIDLSNYRTTRRFK